MVYGKWAGFCCAILAIMIIAKQDVSSAQRNTHAVKIYETFQLYDAGQMQ